MLDFVPDAPPEVDRKIFLKSLKSTPQGASPGCTYEHFRVVLDDPDTWDLLFEAVTSLAHTSVPEEIAVALMGARLTALAKSDGGVRGIATGSSLKRLVARTLAKHFASEFEAEHLSNTRYPRVLTPIVWEHMLRAATDMDTNATILGSRGLAGPPRPPSLLPPPSPGDTPPTHTTTPEQKQYRPCLGEGVAGLLHTNTACAHLWGLSRKAR